MSVVSQARDAASKIGALQKDSSDFEGQKSSAQRSVNSIPPLGEQISNSAQEAKGNDDTISDESSLAKSEMESAIQEAKRTFQNSLTQAQNVFNNALSAAQSRLDADLAAAQSTLAGHLERVESSASANSKIHDTIENLAS